MKTRISIVLAWHGPELITGEVLPRCAFWLRRGSEKDVEKAILYTLSKASTPNMEVHLFETVKQATEWMNEFKAAGERQKVGA